MRFYPLIDPSLAEELYRKVRSLHARFKENFQMSFPFYTAVILRDPDDIEVDISIFIHEFSFFESFMRW